MLDLKPPTLYKEAVCSCGKTNAVLIEQLQAEENPLGVFALPEVVAPNLLRKIGPMKHKSLTFSIGIGIQTAVCA